METITNNPHLKISITQWGQPNHDIEQVEVSERLWDIRCLTLPNNEEYDYQLKEGKKLHQHMLKAPLTMKAQT
jgi:1,4-alpha-glucan branching enzyme